MAKNPGKDFENRMRKRFDQNGFYVHKLADAPAPFIGSDPTQGFTGGARFSPKNPYDFFVLRRRAGTDLFHAYAFELKTTSLPRFCIDTVKPHQVKGLRRFPGTAGVLVEIRQEKRCFFVDVESLNTWHNRSRKKSMNIGDLSRYHTELPLDTSGREILDYYDVSVLNR